MAIGALGRMVGIDLGKIAGNAVSGLLGNSIGGNLAGSIAQGLTSFLSGDPIGAFQGAMNAFQSIGSAFQPGTGNAGMFGPQTFNRMPMMPQIGMGSNLGASPMGGGFGMPNMGSLDPSMGGAASALGQMKDLRGQMQSLIGNKNMSPEDKQLAMMQLQEQMQTIQQLLQMMSNVMKNQHQTAMAIVGNLR